MKNAPGGNRTPGLQVRSLSLYPSELRAPVCSARRMTSVAHGARQRQPDPCVRIRSSPRTENRRGPVAQLAEQQTLNLRVVGSIPTRLTILPKRLSAFFESPASAAG